MSVNYREQDKENQPDGSGEAGQPENFSTSIFSG